MKKIQIDDISYNVPEKWQEVTLERFIQLTKIEDKTDLYNIISVLTSVPVEILLDAEKKLFYYLIGKLDFIKDTPIKLTELDRVYLNNKSYTLLDNLGELSIDRYAALDTLYRVNSELTTDSIALTLALILSPLEEHTDNLLKRYKLFSEVPYLQALYILDWLGDQQQQLKALYFRLFEGSNNQNEQEEKSDSLTYFSIFYSWQETLMSFCDNDLLKYDEIKKKSTHDIFNYMQYLILKSDKNKEEKGQLLL